MSDIDDHEEQELDLSNSDVVTKYKAAAEVVNKSLALVIAECKPGSKLVDIADLGDSSIDKLCGAQFKGKQIEKGIAFPTCLSVNNVVGNYSPLSEDETTLKDGDVLKIDIGAHIDGFVAVAAHTLVVQSEAGPVTGPAADVIQAAHTAAEVAMRLIKPGKTVAAVPGELEKVAEAFGCSVVEGVMTHQMKQFVIDGNKVVLNKISAEQKVEDSEFEENEVYAVDVVMSTGEGKTRVLDEKQTSVYKRALDMEYNLKMKASRAVFSDINRRFPCMPFPIRALDSKQSRFGLVECLNHQLLHPYPVLHEKPDALVAHFKYTVLLMPNGNDKITGAPLQEIKSEKKVEDEDLKKLLQTSLKPKKKNKKKKDTKGAGED
uniref:Proliferation-associated protein 2g4-like n=1 Tax=Tetraselmis sp. GSL018 TaxID=582737 RepID=A0A061QWB6_9CHLO|mmetsp:Transcript_12424/g.29514  ORF Transcript_12424/g.29514 Transcript_12424/m.29514 type:complete len:376 (-) Transcript_12424:383-1510(-)